MRLGTQLLRSIFGHGKHRRPTDRLKKRRTRRLLMESLEVRQVLTTYFYSERVLKLSESIKKATAPWSSDIPGKEP